PARQGREARQARFPGPASRQAVAPPRPPAIVLAVPAPYAGRDGTTLWDGLAARRGLRAAHPLSYRHGLRAVELPRKILARRGLDDAADDGDQRLAAAVAVRRLGLCQPRAAAALGRGGGLSRQSQLAAPRAPGVRDRGDRSAAILGRAGHQIS